METCLFSRVVPLTLCYLIRPSAPGETPLRQPTYMAWRAGGLIRMEATPCDFFLMGKCSSQAEVRAQRRFTISASKGGCRPEASLLEPTARCSLFRMALSSYLTADTA